MSHEADSGGRGEHVEPDPSGRRADPDGGGQAQPIRVAIVDDDALVRTGLSMMLNGAGDLEVVAEVEDGTGVSAALAARTVDVVLMDIRMPRLDGLAATEAIRSRPNPPDVIILTTFDADEHVLRALRAGASGFLLKDTPPARIVEAIRRVASGEPMLSPAVTRRLIRHLSDTPADARRRRARALLADCTDREREVADAVGRGRSNAEISADLHMSVATVKAYVSRLLTRLHLNNRVQLALLVHDADA